MNVQLEQTVELVCDTFKKSRIACEVLSVSELGERLRIRARAGADFGIDFGVMYRLRDELGFCYVYFLLSAQKRQALLVGPYFSSAPTPQHLLNAAERIGVSSTHYKYFEEYCRAIPAIEQGNALFIMLDCLCERLFDSSFAVVDVNGEGTLTLPPMKDEQGTHGELLADMRVMERRYEFENELIRAVEQGQIHKEKLLLSAFDEKLFESRVKDRLRNAKNYAIIMNTLLRKAAERGGVHPLYIDRLSSDFAKKIENLPSESENSHLMRDMFSSYCRLVRKHSQQSYSLPVRQAMLIIDSDLSAELSPGELAKSQNISLGYLCSVFKRETGKTLSEYIREKRMQMASHLLATTQLQIQSVAAKCGIMDVQYFSKMFKVATGTTPKEYREMQKRK